MNDEIKKALEVLKKGGIILYPTDTIWGIGCDATNEKAVERIYQIKQRNVQKGMLILLDNAGKIPSYVREVPEIAWDLIDLADKPLTIIFPQAKNLAKNLVANDGSIGIRITNEPFTQKLIERFRKPIVSTSANLSGEKAPGNFSAINPQIFDLVDYIVQWRQDDYTLASPSGIIKLSVNGEIEVIRK
ncbi:MAG TPA: L-threonylcarbamoyladenylate synthase [Bacteroidales bacterium]|nr:L-threonylcarbamoyladenylate synthase [Bacteroidales bacterium]